VNALTDMSLDGDAATNVDTVKTRVINTIVAADPGVRVKKTDYFNHAFVPDLLLSWPGDKVERQVYLKTSSDPGNLRDDLADMDSESSIVMPLAEGAIVATEREERAGLEQDSTRRHALVASPDAFVALTQERVTRTPIVGFASRALLQGGQGVVAPDRAREFSQSIEEGFAAAQRGGVEETASALAGAEAVLDPARNRQVNEFLGAVWVGSGGSTEPFPGQVEATTTLTGPALALLLDTVDIEDEAFWKRVGQALRVADLATLSLPSTHANFQRLLRAIAPTLKIHALRIIDSEATSFVSPGWFAGAGTLGLKSGPALFRLAGSRLDEFGEDGLDTSGSISQLSRRAEQAGIAVPQLSIEAEARVEFSTADGSTAIGDPQLGEVARALGPDAVVTKATVATGAADIHLDFRSSTAYGNRKGKFYASELVMKTVPLMVAMNAPERAALAEAVGHVDQGTFYVEIGDAPDISVPRSLAIEPPSQPAIESGDDNA
jgi:hypothetical protein